MPLQVPNGATRRVVVSRLAWSVPVVALGAVAPTAAASGSLEIVLFTTDAAAGGFALQLGDGKKSVGSASTNYRGTGPGSGSVALVQYKVTQGGMPVAGVSVIISAMLPAATDAQGNTVLKFVAPGTTTTVSQGVVANSYSAVTDSDGIFTVWVGTTTLAVADGGRRDSNFSVTAMTAGGSTANLVGVARVIDV